MEAFSKIFAAALQLSTIVLHAHGYRAKAGMGHHWISIRSVFEIIGKSAKNYVSYFNSCRAKRNQSDYDCAGRISHSEVEELLREVKTRIAT
ncbi:hypothetical protein SCG7109_AW_00110 [Chlamydiales bacterium SCGC AG-110-M15]|nr:hypothetical protein SCG7109_AW_00110 [Chlamydiales bacterium SCGC AG-110-M15]